MTFQRITPIFILIATLLTLGIGLLSAPLSLTSTIDAPPITAYLSDFRGLERNKSTAYRWSYPQAVLNVHAFARTPLIVDLRLTSPRPADEPPATLDLARGRWRTSSFDVRGDWRRYQVLLPANANQPEIALVGSTFRPDERDQRSLSMALSRIRFSIPSTISWLLAGLAMLGPWRLAMLLGLPLFTYSIALRLLQTRTRALWIAQTAVIISLIFVWSQARDPISAAFLLDEPWIPLLLLLAIGLVWVAYRPHMATVERAIQHLLDSDRTRQWVVVGAACVVGVIMLVSMPPWEHPDESSHFEFAWLIANHPTWPTPGTSDPQLASIAGGGRALYHQPLYHLLISLVLRFVGGLSLVGQLYAARSVSLLLFLLVIAMAERITRSLFPPGHMLRWLTPLALVLNPTFASLMTSVNNDVAVTTVCTLTLLLATRTLMDGLTWRRVLALIATIPLAIACKNTGAITAGIVPFILMIAFWRQVGWRWRWLLLTIATTSTILLALMLSWGDPANWYRWGSATQGQVVRVTRPEAPIGTHVLRVNSVAIPDFEGLSGPNLLESQISGRHVTVGAWVWASRPAQIWAPGVVYQIREGPLLGDHRGIDVGTQPRFVAFGYDLPARLMFAHMMVWSVAPNDPAPLDIYFDGMVLAIGTYPTEVPPQYGKSGTADGTWGGQPFVNLIRNGDAEQGWFYLRPEIDRLIARFARRSPSRLIASFADLGTTLRLEITDYLPWMMFTSFGAYGGRIFLRDPLWQWVIPGVALVIMAGIIGGLRNLKRFDPPRQITLIALSLISLTVWAVIILAHLPVNFLGGIPSPRYGFTIMIPTMLIILCGWLNLWPTRYRRIAAIVMLGSLLLLSIAAVTTMRLFDSTACSFDPVRCAFSPIPSPFSLLIP
jgi:hypothetical protein